MVRNLLNKAVLEKLAGKRAFERGADYFADGHVIGLKENNGAVTATVRGSYDYRVKLWAEGEALAFECNCPVGQDSAFCKHCVASGLAWLERCEQKTSGSQPSENGDVTDDEIRTFLMARDKGALAELVLEHSEWDAEFRDRLVLMTAERGGKQPDLAAFRAAIDKAIRHRGFVDYNRMPAYARGIEAVIDSLEALLSRGHAKAVRELVERALQRLESAMNDMDDSDGFMGGILGRLQQLHLSACQLEKPNPLTMAKFLFEWEVRSGWEMFLGAAETYADVLGESGLAEYRKLAETKWARVPLLAPGEKDPEQYRSRWRITHIMETLEKQTGDVDALVAIKSRDLSHAFSFLEIAKIYKAAGNHEAAMQWAERGARAFPEHTDSRLREFLIEEYHRQKRHSEAVAIAWTGFCERPGLDAYIILHKSASKEERWPEWREKALALLRQEIAQKKERRTTGGWGPPAWDNSELVSIYLWEGDTEAAWAEAKTGGCHDGVWFRLAEAREKDHPEDAIAIYTAQLRRALQQAQPQAYREAVKILRRIHKLDVRIGNELDFAALVQSVRTQFKARRNLIKLLDAEGWSGHPSPR